MPQSKCRHRSKIDGVYRGYTSPVFTPGKTDENRGAHGAVTYTETCDACGMQRRINSNGRHTEFSAWFRAEKP